MFESSVILLAKNNQLDTSIVHGDGTSSAAKKGATTSDEMDTRRSKGINSLLFVTEIAMLLRHLSLRPEIEMNHQCYETPLKT